jgi:hypothetical protein
VGTVREIGQLRPDYTAIGRDVGQTIRSLGVGPLPEYRSMIRRRSPGRKSVRRYVHVVSVWIGAAKIGEGPLAGT